jgi:glucose-1-phosphate cytidylyltransferase
VIFERAPLEKLAKDNQLHAYKHSGFWRPMDTLRDKTELNALWSGGVAPWAVWLK